jgi:hypothetical protein
MRSHSEIIRDAGGAAQLARKLGMADRQTTVRQWLTRDSIAPKYWAEFARLEIATTHELAAAAAASELKRKHRADVA